MAKKSRPKVYFPVLDEAIAAYMRRTGRTQASIAQSLYMTDPTFSSKRKGEREFTFTEMNQLCGMLNMTLDEAARGAVITYPTRDTAVA